jgi:RNA polymerase sigma factor (sigma-70 family)
MTHNVVHERVPVNNSAELIGRIRNGDSSAWRELVDHYEPLLRRLAWQYRLSGQDMDDAIQLTWLRCLEHIDQITHADRLRGWLATVCRRESIRLVTKRRREVALGEQSVMRLVDQGQDEHDPGAEMARRDAHARLSRAITALPEKQRLVLIELLKEENRSYLELSRRLGLPVGSIGPTRQRAIARLRQDPQLAGLSLKYS